MAADVSQKSDSHGDLGFHGDLLLSHNNVNGSMTVNYSSHPGSVRPWTVPRDSSRHFIGRQDTIAALQTALATDSQPTGPHPRRCAVLHGMGGTDKSEVCIKFAELNRSHYWGVLWVDCGSPQTAFDSFRRAADLCSVPCRDLSAARSWISSTAPHQRTLLILDNADHPRIDISKYIPSNGDVIITTRNIRLTDYAHHDIRLEQLSETEAVELLLKSYSSPHADYEQTRRSATRLVQRLGCHTLAVRQAGAHLVSEGVSLDAYVAALAQQEQALMNFQPSQEAPEYRSIHATFEVSHQFIVASSSNESNRQAMDALAVLDVLSFFHRESDFVPLVQAAHNAATKCKVTPEEVASDLDLKQVDSNLLPDFAHPNLSANVATGRCRAACNLLSGFALLAISSDGDTVSVHPVVHLWLRQRLRGSNDKPDHPGVKAAALVAFAMRYGGRLVDRFWNRPLLQHANAICDSSNFRATCQPVSISLCTILLRLMDLKYRYEPGLSMGVDLAFSRLILDMETYIAGFSNAESPQRSRRAPLRQLWSRRKVEPAPLAKIPMPWPKLMCEAYCMHAHWSSSTGTCEVGLALAEKAAQLSEQCFPPNDEAYMRAKNVHAHAFIKSGQPSKAVSMLQSLLESGNLTSNLAKKVRLNLGQALYRDKQYQAALETLQSAWRDCRLKPDSGVSYMVDVGYWLARSHAKTDQVDEAIQVMQTITSLRLQRHRPDGSATLEDPAMLAALYCRKGQIGLAKQVIRDRQQQLEDAGRQDLFEQLEKFVRAWTPQLVPELHRSEAD